MLLRGTGASVSRDVRKTEPRMLLRPLTISLYNVTIYVTTSESCMRGCQGRLLYELMEMPKAGVT